MRKTLFKLFIIEQCFIIVSLFFELYNRLLKHGMYIVFNFLEGKLFEYIDFKVIILCFISLNIIFAIYFFSKKRKIDIFDWMYKKRFIAAFAIFCLCILFEINGSSIGCWDTYLKNSNPKSNVILGTSRPIRSDEWAVNTPMSFSQYYNNFEKNSSIIRGTDTDVFIVYGQPVKDISIIFRPFQIGYLFLSPEKGLSFFWCGRLIALFLLTFEFGMLLTNKNKKLSLVLALMITFAPTVQWWFAVNGLVEMIVFAELAIILFDKYLKSDNSKLRALYLAIIYVCLGGYILTFYPAWMIPIAYVFLPIIIYIFIKNFKNIKFKKIDIFTIIIISFIFILLMVRIFLTSWQTIQTVTQTVYPGERFETGGGQIDRYFESILSPILPIYSNIENSNSCEFSMIIDLWPISVILVGMLLIKEKKKDICTILMLIIASFLNLYCIIGFPDIISKITLLSNCQAGRVAAVAGILNLFILVRTLSILDFKFNKKIAFILSEILVCLLVFISKIFNSAFVTYYFAAFIILIFSPVFYYTFRANEEKNKFVAVISMIMLLSGGLVNPIAKGANSVYENELGKEIQNIVNEDKSALWIVEGASFPITNYPMILGANTINTTNVYPVLERWYGLDENKENEFVYNRYAHISFELNENLSKTEFELIAPDSMKVKINLDNLQNKLNVKYILTTNNFDKIYGFEKLYENGEFYIYKINK